MAERVRVSKSSSQSSQSSGRLAFLDALRGIAALAVFLQHAVTAVTTHFLPFIDIGRFGVLLFFLCSGFIIPASLERHPSAGTFWINRFWRLYPLYWVSIAGAVGLAAIGHFALPAEFVAQPGIASAANATMVQFLFGMPDAIRVYWSLTYELIFYGLVTVLFRLGLLRRPELVTGALLLITVLLGFVLPLAGGLATEGFALILVMIATMFVGMVAHAAYTGARPRGAAFATAGVALLTVALLFIASNLREGIRLDRVIYAACTWGGAYLVFGLVLVAHRKPFPRALVALGSISYSIYLLHDLVIAAIPPQPTPLLSVASWLLVGIVIAAATYRWVELPGIALGRRMVRWRSRHARRTEGEIALLPLAAVPAAEASTAD